MVKETHEHAVKRGKRSRAQGKAFERKVREDLENQDWIVVRWDKNVEWLEHIAMGAKVTYFAKDNKIEKKIEPFVPEVIVDEDGHLKCGELVNSKPKFNPFTKALMMNSSGFPDFICIKHVKGGENGEPMKFLSVDESPRIILNAFLVKFVECKLSGKLDKEEQEKCNWIESNLKIPIKVAYKEGNEIKYKKWDEK